MERTWFYFLSFYSSPQDSNLRFVCQLNSSHPTFVAGYMPGTDSLGNGQLREKLRVWRFYKAVKGVYDYYMLWNRRTSKRCFPFWPACSLFTVIQRVTMWLKLICESLSKFLWWVFSNHIPPPNGFPLMKECLSTCFHQEFLLKLLMLCLTHQRMASLL